MSDCSSAYGETDHVVEGLSDRARNTPGKRLCAAMKRLYAAVCVMLAASLWITPASYAEDGDSVDAGDAEGGVTITSSITDTENLLGSDVSAVTDAIDDTKERTGVSVRLLYLASFATDEEPEDWARDVLDSTDPDPDTVLLAVASYDGSLVVAVSSNSDAWLRNQDTVDRLSQAALDPLIEGDTPDWSGSAIAMMDEIGTIEQAARTPSPVVIGVVAGVVVVVAAGAAAAVVISRRRGKSGPRRARRGRGGTRKHDKADRTGQAAPEDATREDVPQDDAGADAALPTLVVPDLAMSGPTREPADGTEHDGETGPDASATDAAPETDRPDGSGTSDGTEAADGADGGPEERPGAGRGRGGSPFRRPSRGRHAG